MDIRARSVLLAGLLSVAVMGSAEVKGQPNGAYPVQQAGGPAGPPPFMAGGPGGQMVDAYGNPAIVPAIVPASYCGPGGCYGGGACYGGAGGYNEMADLFGGAGFNHEQSGPHYFDISGEFLYWRRGNLGGRTVPFTALGAALNPVVGANNIVQTSDSVNTGFEPGFRIVGRFDLGALSVIEASYTGLLNQTANSNAAATLFSNNNLTGNLFSPFTNFGVSFLDAANSVPNPFAGGVVTPPNLDVFDDTDRATSHSLSFDSNLQNAELNYRRYWVGYSPRLTGTLLAGFRYTRLDEAFLFSSTGANFVVPPVGPTPPPTEATTANFSVDAANDLAGFQVGGDASLAIRQGIRLNTEGKVGIFNNDVSVSTAFSTTDGTPAAFTESFSENQVAFITDVRLTLVVDVLPSVSLKAGYEVLFLNSIATAVDNINFTGIPAGVATARVARFDNQGDAVYHGAHFGMEWVW